MSSLVFNLITTCVNSASVSLKYLHAPFLPPRCLCDLSVCRSVLSQPTSYRPRLLLEGRLGSGQSSHLAPAVLHTLEKFTVYTLDMAVLFGASATAPEETCAQVKETPGHKIILLLLMHIFRHFLQ